MANTTAPAPRTFDVAVDMTGYLDHGIVLVEVTALDYASAYRAAVEALLIDPAGVIRHRQRAILAELGYV